MGRRSRIRCAACGKRIRNHEPDLVLENLKDAGARRRYYHTTCSKSAYAAAAAEPAVYVLTVRHIDLAAN